MSARRSGLLRALGTALGVSAFVVLICGLAWTYSTHRYLNGFADAIVPLQGSPQEKTEALLEWFRRSPGRSDAFVKGGDASLRDPVNIVQNRRLLKICGSASNAFINLADLTGVRTRRLLLLAPSGDTMHVVAEVQTDGHWVVVDPQSGRSFRDRSGRALTRQELRDPEVFRDAISRMPAYSPTYTFEHTAYLHLERIPLIGHGLRRVLDRASPRWEEAADWGYVAENPSLWPVLISVPILFMGLLLRLMARRYGRNAERSGELFGGIRRKLEIPHSARNDTEMVSGQSSIANRQSTIP